MITGRDFTVKQAQHQDRLNRAEKNHLIRQAVSKCKKPAIWQNVSNLVLGIDQKNQPARGQACLVKKTA